MIGVVNGHVDIEPMNASISVRLRHFPAARTLESEHLQPTKQMEALRVCWSSKPGNRALRSGNNISQTPTERRSVNTLPLLLLRSCL